MNQHDSRRPRKPKNYMIGVNQILDDALDILTGKIDGNLDVIEPTYFKFADGHIEKVTSSGRHNLLTKVPDVHQCDKDGKLL